MKRALFTVITVLMMFTLAACSSNQKANIQQKAPSANGDSAVTVSIDKEQEKPEPINDQERAVAMEKAPGESTATSEEPITINKPSETNNSSSTENRKIKMTFNGNEVIANLYDNPASQDLLTMLPLTLTFKDYNGTEKISYLPRNISTKDAPDGFDPSIGDLALYAPWGNIAIYYNDFSYSQGLVSLGHIETGIEKLAAMHGDFKVRIEILGQ